MSTQDPAYLDTKFMVDPYMNWVKAEGVPVIAGNAINLLQADVSHWPRFGMKGAVCHVDGRCDYLTAFLFELAPGGRSEPQRHVAEAVFYCLEGEGETHVTLSNGATQCIAWSAKRLFAVPVNATAVHHATGKSRARCVALSDLRYLMGLYRKEAFLFANPSPMHERQANAIRAGLVIDPLQVEPGSDERIPLSLADMSVGVDATCLGPHASSLARRQMQGSHMLGCDGAGFTLSFKSNTSDIERIDWRHGILAGLAGMTFHQHFNTGDRPARVLSVEMGSLSSPMFRSRRAVYGDTQVYASGAASISRADERAEVRGLA